MKNILLTFSIIFYLILPSQISATERTFPVGSYILPMDSVYQPSADGGIFEAYGLVYTLLDKGVTVYWIINENKTSMDGIDVTISDGSATAGNPVVQEYNHNNGVTNITGITTSASYRGAPFVIDSNDTALTQTIINATLNDSAWSAVNIHKTNVPFSANVSREMLGKPPMIALMNSEEDKTKGNAAILESYLRLAGICSSTYNIVTPLEIKAGILETPVPYDLLWAPHWTGFDKYPADVEAIITKVADFLERGGGLFAECASIEAFEHSVNGKFLTDNGFGHNGGTMDSTKMVYSFPTEAYNQIGDFVYSPEGGHLHNWKPFKIGDPYTSVGTPPIVDSSYNNTVKRFTYDDADSNFSTTTDQWDYYVGGRYKGDPSKGYVVYLGGHKYSSCSGGSMESATPGTHNVKFEFKENITAQTNTNIGVELEFKENITNETFELTINYNSNIDLTISNILKSSHAVSAEDSNLKVDFTNADFSSDKKIKNISFENKGTTTATINYINVNWTDGNPNQKFKKIKNNGTIVFDGGGGGVVKNTNNTTTAFVVGSDLVEFEFTKNISNELFDFIITYNITETLTVNNVSKASHSVSASDSNLKVDFSNGDFISDNKKIKVVEFRKLGTTDISINSIQIFWDNGHADQKTKKIKHNSTEVFNGGGGVANNSVCTTTSFSIGTSSNIEEYTFTVNYNSGSSLTITPISKESHAVLASNSTLSVNFTNAVFKTKEIEDVIFENIGTSGITIDSIDISWTGSRTQKIKEIYDNDNHVFEVESGVDLSTSCTTTDFTIEAPGATSSTSSCTNNSDCTWKNIAGVRYVLNTLFNLQFDVVDVKFSKATPIVHNDLLFRGSYKYPSYKGEFDLIDIESISPSVKWSASSHIDIADDRNIYTILDTDGTIDGIIKSGNPSLIDFSVNNLSTNSATKTFIQNAFELNYPYAGNETNYEDLLHKVRGKEKNSASVFQEIHKLGAIMHSSSAIVEPFSRNNSTRATVAYVNTLYGMLNAFKIPPNKSTLDAELAVDPNIYKELWAFIPFNQLGSLKNNRLDDPPTTPVPGIDASPTVSEVFIDHDSNPSTEKVWKTVLVSLNGIYGKHSSIFALDITNPDPAVVGGGPVFLWETRGKDHPAFVGDIVPATTIIMGSGYRTTISKLNVDENSDGQKEEKYYVFTATNYVDTGNSERGLRIFAFDLVTGEQKWVFSVPYSSQNEVPGALTAVDTNSDGYVDSLFLGDMDGRLWMLNAEDGVNPFGQDSSVTIVTAGLFKNIIYKALNFFFKIPNVFALSAATSEIPLFNGGSYTAEADGEKVNAGIGYPISGSISVAKSNSGAIIAYFGTGGADWANLTGSEKNHIYAIDATNLRSDKNYKNGAGTVLWDFELEAGEKVWGAVTIAGKEIYVGTTFGTIESSNPNDDACSVGSTCGNIRFINKESGSETRTKVAADSKIRSSVYMKKGHLYATLNNGQVQQFGDGTFTTDNYVQSLSWIEK